ncbi:amidohydrolase family protein [Ensifer adhaerens]
MLTRKGPSGVVYGEDQTIGLERAIESMTFAGAYASHSETVKGKLLPGHCADIAILDRDIRALSPEEIASTKVDATIIDGRVVFDRYEAVACEPR